LVKLVIEEPESAALRDYLGVAGRMYASRIAAVELRRAVRRLRQRAASEQAELVIGTLRLIELDDELARAAGEAQPITLRTLDAIHLSAALALGDECAAFVSYDNRLSQAARQARLEVRAPA